MIRAAALAIALCLAATAAGAQDAPVTTAPPAAASPPADFDPIAAVLADPEAYSTDVEEEEPAPAPAPPSPAPPSPAPLTVTPAPITLPPLTPLIQRPKLDRPVLIDEKGLTPDGPPGPQDVGYDMRIRANIADAQGRQGPLDGGWTVAGEGGAKLYSLQLVDTGSGPLEGAWRSLQRAGIGTTGLIASLERGATSLTVRFGRGGTDNPTVIIVNPQLDGSWSGQMWEDGKVATVTMRR